MQLPGYSELSRLSQGGMATVYKAHQDSLDRVVAIKFLSAEFLWDEQMQRFFDQESLVIARLNHPNIIHIIDRGVTPKGRPYFVMDYIPGRDLSTVRKQNNLSFNLRVQLLMQICKGMAFAHKNGVIHRDIKPANILVDAENHVYILDFGIAWLEASGTPADEEMVGTPDYMSPEQFNDAQAVSHLSDIYALGALMFEFFTGELPAQYINDLATGMKALPQSLQALIIACLQTDPKARPQSADEVSFTLLKILQGAHIGKTQQAEAVAAIGKSADKFRLLDVLSQNRFGAVYLFEDRTRQLSIVVKKRVKTDSGLQQARQLSQLKHRNLLRILGSSSNAKSFIVVMEYVSGGNLQDRLSRPYTPAQFIPVALQLCEAMLQAHQHEILHGNLRPSNILFDQKGVLKVADFGFEKHYQQVAEVDWYQPENRAAPSVARDIFSAGSIFYHMLTATTPVMKFGLLKPGKEFEALDAKLQLILRNMLEMQSLNRLVDFAAVKTALQAIPVEATQAANVSRQHEAKPFGLKWFVVLLILANTVGLAAFYYFSSAFQHFIDSILAG